VHAIAFIASRRAQLEDFVHPYYSVQMFKLAYAVPVPPMPSKDEWEMVDPGFKLLPPLCKRAAGRPRKRRIHGVEEGGSSSQGKRRCKRCGGYGHLQKTCNETVHDADAPPPAPPAKKRRTYKPKVVEIIETTDEPSNKNKRKASTKGKQPSKKKKATPTAAKQAVQYVIHLFPTFICLSKWFRNYMLT
jgi:hypothetical protein